MSSVKYFLVVYEKKKGLRDLSVFYENERDLAATRLHECEEAYLRAPQFEVVLLGGESLSAVMLTHGRYFYPASELAHQMLAAWGTAADKMRI